MNELGVYGARIPITLGEDCARSPKLRQRSTAWLTPFQVPFEVLKLVCREGRGGGLGLRLTKSDWGSKSAYCGI